MTDEHTVLQQADHNVIGHDDQHRIRDKKVLLVKISEIDFSVNVVHRES